MVDPIADLLTRIRNAGLAHHASTRVPFSTIKARIVEIMREEGFIESFSVDERDGLHKELVVHLRYIEGNKIAIHNMQRVSRPGRRVYAPAKEIPQIKAGLGIDVVAAVKSRLAAKGADA